MALVRNPALQQNRTQSWRDGPSQVYQQSTRVMEEAADALASSAVASRDLRPDIHPKDTLRAIYGISSAGSTDDWPARARLFVDILIQGSRP